MPSNLYGPGDNYDPKNSHVIPAMIKKFHNAKKKIYLVWLFGGLENQSVNFYMLTI